MRMKPEERWQQEIVEIIPRLRNWIHRYTGNREDTDEVLQLTLIKALQNLVDFSEPFNLQSWLMTIARNQSFDYLKERGRLVHTSSFVLERNFAVDEMNDPAVVESMGNLPLRDQYLLFMKYFTHQKVSEISKLLKIPEGSIKRQLHDARNRLKKEMTMPQKEKHIAPEIKIEKVENPPKITVQRTGYGLFMGSPVKGVGDVERIAGYEHPGRIHVFEADSAVTRQAEVLGKQVWEVHNTYDKREGEAERFLYYTIEDDTIAMPFRVLHFGDPDKVSVDFDQKELVQPMNLTITAPSTEIGEKETVERDIVKLTVGDTIYENCIRVRTSEDDYHGRNYTESFIDCEGREVLHKTYISEGWKMGGFVTWEKWKDAPELEFHGEKFRLWFEFVLVGTRKATEDEMTRPGKCK